VTHRLAAPVLLALLVLVCSIGASAAPSEEYYLQLTFDSRKDLSVLTKLVSIDNVVGDTVFAYANDRQLASLEASGYAFTVLPHPSSQAQVVMSSEKDIEDWDAYPTYPAYVAMMEDFVANYPSLCVLDTIGTTVQGRLLLVLKISDNPSVNEAEPEVLYTSSMHGDETTAYVLTLRLADSLLSTYGVDPVMTALVDNLEIFINPLANPDGTYYGGDNTLSGARRYNANGVDLNRNFPDPEDGQHPDGNSWQPETIAWMDWAADHNCVLSANFHGGAEVFNYPWDTWSTRHADDAWWQFVGHEYCDTAQTYSPPGYLDGFNDGITNGSDWYEVAGGRQDYFGYFHGGREVTMEISDTKLLSASLLPAWWGYNRRSLVNYLEQAYYGIRGTVTDAITSDPLAATIRVLGHDIDNSEVFTDPLHGDYYRMIKGGTYTLEFSSPGYFSDTVTGVTVADYASVVLNVQLTPLPNEPVITFSSQNAGLVSSGETAAFKIALTNLGAGNATGVQAVLSCDDTLITVTTASAAYPNLTALGGTQFSLTDYVIEIDPGTPPEYEAAFNLEVTADGSYANCLSFSMMINASVEDFESGDFSTFAWTFDGTAPWTITTTETHSGVYAARSGVITHNQTTGMAVTINNLVADTISFWYKVSSESGWDFLRFYIDGAEQQRWSGSVDWTRASYPTTAGTHTFRWAYTKDGSQSTGSDAAWVDFIEWPSSNNDKDGDGYTDAVDNCPDDFNPEQADDDTDGHGNLCDNCLSVFNPDQKDDNENGIGDACECCQGSTGNANNDASDAVDLSDLIYLVNYLFLGGPAPVCVEEANTNGDVGGSVDLSDLIHLVNFLFLGGQSPALCL
jgi:hypothetical protein